jgi:hypothetical protein
MPIESEIKSKRCQLSAADRCLGGCGKTPKGETEVVSGPLSLARASVLFATHQTMFQSIDRCWIFPDRSDCR